MKTALTLLNSRSKSLFSNQNFFSQQTKGFTTAQKVLLTSYTLLTAVMLFAALFFVVTRGFKY